MGQYDNLYDIFKQADEQRKQNNFNRFMSSFDATLVQDLDNAWANDPQDHEYDQLLSNIKSRGIRVFRNSNGKHKLSFVFC